MKTTIKNLSLVGVLSLAASQTALASDWSVGLFAGQSTIDDLDEEVCRPVVLTTNIQLAIRGIGGRLNCVADDSDSALGLNVAYSINNYYGVEAGYAQLGEYTVTLSGFGNTDTITLDAKALYIAGVATYPLSDRLSASARLGVFNASGDVTSSTSNDIIELEEDEVLGYGGLSLAYKLSDRISAELRYDRFDSIDVTGLGLRFHF